MFDIFVHALLHKKYMYIRYLMGVFIYSFVNLSINWPVNILLIGNLTFG